MSHREMLTRRKLSLELDVLQDLIKMAKHTKGRALHSRPFAQLCAEMDAERTISSHADVRRLSAGGPLARGLSRRVLIEKQSTLAARFSDPEWVTKLADLCDVFSLLNQLSLSLQGRTAAAFKAAGEVAAFKAKLGSWGLCMNTGIFNMFQTLAEIRK